MPRSEISSTAAAVPRLRHIPTRRSRWCRADPTGFSPGLDVKDEQGREWSVKLGPEARTEVVASRIVWAMGYHQPPVYYLPHFALRDNGTVKTDGPGRFRLKPSTQKSMGAWSWRRNPFLNTQPFAGLFVLMAVINNWDIKTPQNAVYRTSAKGASPEYQYVIKDLGASFGKTQLVAARHARRYRRVRTGAVHRGDLRQSREVPFPRSVARAATSRQRGAGGSAVDVRAPRAADARAMARCVSCWRVHGRGGRTIRSQD